MVCSWEDGNGGAVVVVVEVVVVVVGFPRDSSMYRHVIVDRRNT